MKNHILYQFRDYVFEPPYSPHYDSYNGHLFLIDHYHSEKFPDDYEDESVSDIHVWLICFDDPSVIVKGYVELDMLEIVSAVQSLG